MCLKQCLPAKTDMADDLLLQVGKRRGRCIGIDPSRTSHPILSGEALMLTYEPITYFIWKATAFYTWCQRRVEFPAVGPVVLQEHLVGRLAPVSAAAPADALVQAAREHLLLLLHSPLPPPPPSTLIQVAACHSSFIRKSGA